MPVDYTGPVNDLGKLRLILGDRDPARALLSDAELSFFLTEYGSLEAAVIPAVRAMIAAASSAVDWSSGAESESASQRVRNLERLEQRLLAQGYTEPSSREAMSGVRRFDRITQEVLDEA